MGEKNIATMKKNGENDTEGVEPPTLFCLDNLWGFAIQHFNVEVPGQCRAALDQQRAWIRPGIVQNASPTASACPRALPAPSRLCHANRSARLASTGIQPLPGAAGHEQEVFCGLKWPFGPCKQ